MVNLILKFASCARAAGLRISTSEVLDCLSQLELVDVAEEAQFETVLRSNFAKSRREQYHFDRLYHLFFHEMRQDESISHSMPLADQTQTALEALASQNDANDIFQSVLDFLQGDPLEFLEQLQQISDGGNGNGQTGGGFGGNFRAVTRWLEIMLQLNAVQKALEQYLAAHRSEIGWEDRRDMQKALNARLQSARRLLSANSTVYDDKSEPTSSYDKHLGDLGEIHFASLTKREVEEMREVIERLVRKLKDKVSLRFAVKNRGALDIKKTLRRSAAYQGIPLEIVYRNRPPRKAKIVTLCDVSGSVWSAARFMLNMLYSLQECFTQVRSFVFVAGLDEVTTVFENHDIHQAIDTILKEANIAYDAATDYGLTLRQFKQNHMDILNKKTTLIVIGDGRTNYSNPEEQILAEMHDRCRRLIWLNPETEQFWYTGDSEMRAYQFYCDEIRQCQNLNQLMDFIKSLVL